MQTLYYGGDIITMERENETVEAVLVEEGRIRKTGALPQIEPLLERNAVRKNLDGRTMLPAFIDSHSHICVTAQMLSVCDLSGCENFGELVERMKAYIESGKSGPDMAVGFGYDHNFLAEGKHPDRWVLDRISVEIPVFVLHASAHMGSANSAGLKLCGIDEETGDPKGGVIGRVTGSREPDGYLEEAGMTAMQRKLAQVMGKADMSSLMEEAQELYLQNGITTVQDGASGPSNIKLLKALAEEGKLKVDVIAYPMLPDNGRQVLKDYPEYDGRYKNRLKIGGYKLVLDGSPQGRSAWMTEPYDDSGDYRGYPWMTEEEAEKYIRQAVDDDRQLLVHCNGDAAADQYLRNYQKAYRQSVNPHKDCLRPVMIHCQTIRDDQLDQMAQLHMIPSIFVAHTYYWGDVHLQNLGGRRGSRISPARSAFDRGLFVNFHQDTPVVKPLMLHTVWCAVNRRTRKGRTIGPDQRVSVYEAFKAVTINAAYAYYEEDEKGSICEGKKADLVILDRNPLKCEPMQIRDIAVLETVKEGVSVYRKGE